MKTIFLILPFLLISCMNRQEHPAPPQIMVLINGMPIKEDELRIRIHLEKSKYDDESFSDPARFKKVKKMVLDRMIENQIIIDWGEKQGILLSNEEKVVGIKRFKQGYTEKEFELMLEEKDIPYILWSEIIEKNLWAQKIIAQTVYEPIKITHNQTFEHYQKNQSRYEVDEQVRARHIVTDSLDKAQKIYAKLMNGENFAKLAIVHSLSPDRSKGGDLGYFARGTHPIEFDEICFKLEIGETSPVVKSPYGFHIFKLIDKKPKGTIPFIEVKAEIEKELIQKKATQIYSKWIKEVRGQSQVRIIEEALEAVKP